MFFSLCKTGTKRIPKNSVPLSHGFVVVFCDRLKEFGSVQFSLISALFFLLVGWFGSSFFFFLSFFSLFLFLLT